MTSEEFLLAVFARFKRPATLHEVTLAAYAAQSSTGYEGWRFRRTGSGIAAPELNENIAELHSRGLINLCSRDNEQPRYAPSDYGLTALARAIGRIMPHADAITHAADIAMQAQSADVAEAAGVAYSVILEHGEKYWLWTFYDKARVLGNICQWANANTCSLAITLAEALAVPHDKEARSA